MSRLDQINVGDILPEKHHTATEVSLFLYNAAIWNPHRIHYDAPYTLEVEKHPAIVIDGPLQGDWLAQCVTDWLGADGQLVTFSYSNRRAAYLGETLTATGEVIAKDETTRTVDVRLGIRNEKGEIIAPGSATLKFG
jgi:hydroxyacyl-ACP dehydratase HTD2-like protein with hotdog domain